MAVFDDVEFFSYSLVLSLGVIVSWAARSAFRRLYVRGVTKGE